MLDVSVVVVCFNEEQHIGACLHSLLQQTYPADHREIVVVDGGSHDQTVKIVQSYENAGVLLIVEPRKGTAIGRNAGVAQAKYPYIAFIDADCEAPDDWLERLVAHFEQCRKQDTAVVAVGGGNLSPPDAPNFVQAVSVAMDSFAGSFKSAQGRQFEAMCPVESLPTLNVMYLREAIVTAGAFDVSLGSEAEDADLNFRLKKSGWRFVYIPNLSVLHKFRPTPAIWYRNMVRYGRGRGRLLKRHPDMWGMTFVMPPIFLLGMSSLLLMPLHPVFWLPWGYFPIILLYAFWLCWRKHRMHLTWHVALVFVVQHFGYAVGEVSALLNPRIK